MNIRKIDKNALAAAVKNTAKLRVETVGGDKSRPAETVQSCLNRGFNTLGSADGISYILRHAIKYYLVALQTTHGATDEDQVAYWKGAYERMAARNNAIDCALRDAAELLDGKPEYHYIGMGCGLEDRGITDRYEAMQHGWDCAMERIASEHVIPARDILRTATPPTA